MIVACDGATVPRSIQSNIDDSRVPAALRAAYFEDASRMALRDLLTNGFNEVPIPREAVQPYYDALVLVYNATALPARDTVVNVYQVHSFPQPATRGVYLLVADDQVWAQRLAADSLPTGNELVDQLLANYELSVDHVFRMTTTNEWLIVLRSAEPLNMAGLASSFEQVSGVRAGANGAGGDGNDIGGTRDDVTLIDYSVAYGDCWSGCISRRFYHFAVHSDDTVEYLGASGSPPPRPGQP